MDRHIIQFKVIGGLAIGFLGLPGQEVIGFGDGFCLWFNMIVTHLVSPFLIRFLL